MDMALILGIMRYSGRVGSIRDDLLQMDRGGYGADVKFDYLPVSTLVKNIM